jgi:hypothetical protein
MIIALAAAVPALAGLEDGLVAEYSFEGDAVDSSGNGNDGTPYGAPTYTEGHIGQAVALDGVDDVIHLPGDLWTTDFTTAFWVRTTVVAPAGMNWFEGLGIVDGEVCASPAGGDFGIAMINGGHVISYGTATTAEINDGVFHSVIVTRSVADDTVKTYIDGQFDVAYLAPSSGLTGMPWIGVGNNPCDTIYNRRWFPGDIDELRFYNRILGDEEIAELSRLGGPSAVLDPAGRQLFTSVFPNPASRSSHVMFALPAAMETHLAVYDLRGARVRTLEDGRRSEGPHSIIWQGDDDRGRPVGPGVYFVILRAGGLEDCRKVVLIR